MCASGVRGSGGIGAIVKDCGAFASPTLTPNSFSFTSYFILALATPVWASSSSSFFKFGSALASIDGRR